MIGLCHLALRVQAMARSRAFYQDLLEMKVVWEPDPENIYLSSGRDNLALHQMPEGQSLPPETEHRQPLDHFGFIVESKEAVDQILEKMQRAHVPILQPVRLHRDGSYSFYMRDPDGNRVQILYEPRLVSTPSPSKNIL